MHLIWAGDKGVVIVALLASRSSSMMDKFWNELSGFLESLSSLNVTFNLSNRKWQDYVYIQCEYKSTKQKIKHLLGEENKVKENKIS